MIDQIKSLRPKNQEKPGKERPERIVTRKEKAGDGWQNALRPLRFKDYVGQPAMKENLSVYIRAATARKQAMDHVLLYGPPGLGKTTMANIIANELGVSFRVTSGPAIDRPGDLAAILSSLKPFDVLFIDEIHRLSRAVEEVLYSAMEDFKIDVVMGKGMGARSLRLDVPPFTLIGATTRAGALSAPLRDRFGIIFRMEFYSVEELALIVKRAAGILNVKIDDGGADEIARRSRGTPRIANRLLKRVRDFAEVMGEGIITHDMAADALDKIHVDPLGLDAIDRELLRAIILKFNGGPVGLDTIAASINEERDTIEDVYEPYLMQMGFLIRTPRGRMATKLAYDHLHIPWNTEAEENLFTRSREEDSEE